MLKQEKELVFVGLGNPGKKYEFTRHNIGSLIITALGHVFGLKFKEDERFSARLAKGRTDQKKVTLFLPETYMNESGKAVKAYLAFHHLKPEQIVVVNDDIHVEYGEIRFRLEGSAGGHNGLKSIEAHLETRAYPRLKVGIGRGDSEKPLVDYVLGLFNDKELKELPEVVERAVEALKKMIVAKDLKEVLTTVNVRKKE